MTEPCKANTVELLRASTEEHSCDSIGDLCKRAADLISMQQDGLYEQSQEIKALKSSMGRARKYIGMLHREKGSPDPGEGVQVMYELARSILPTALEERVTSPEGLPEPCEGCTCGGGYTRECPHVKVRDEA